MDHVRQDGGGFSAVTKGKGKGGPTQEERVFRGSLRLAQLKTGSLHKWLRPTSYSSLRVLLEI